MKTLLITPRMLSNAKSNKMLGVLEMHPMDFLRLTTTQSSVYDFIRQEKDRTKSLDEYNKFASSGDSIHMPWLDVDIHTGKVIGHEGRHRAMSILNANGDKMPVGICLREKGYALLYREGEEHPWEKTWLTAKDVPSVFIGQFVHREVPIKIQNFKELK